MKLLKYTVYILDFEDYGPEEYKTVIEQHRHLPGAQVFIEDETDIGEWDDDIDINQNKATRENYENYFKRTKNEN